MRYLLLTFFTFHCQMVADALPRAKRLRLLREAKARKESGEGKIEEAGMIVTTGAPTPENETMEHNEVPQSTTDTDQKSEEIVEKIAQVQEEGANTEDESDEELLNLAPKRANWDMERDIAPMLRKLERRTQHAIVEILRTCDLKQ
uniref:Secreted RxLR effector protein 100 n=1 Tax=Plasmopara viticola TaxID=143451 RepID=RL100_PLAVT|nr:RecName: Full=Secreted RxLR effector protein 100; Flags: Precursor [Plasmopara viticola]